MREALASAPGLRTPGRPLRIAFLGDRSETVDGDVAQVRGHAWAPLQLGGVLQADTWAAWQDGVRTLAVTLAADHSARTKQPVHVADYINEHSSALKSLAS